MPKTSAYNNKTKKEEISEAPQVEELLKNLEFHKAIQSITGRINAADTLPEIIVDIKEDIRKLFNIHVLTIYYIDKITKEICTLQRDGNEIKEIRFPVDNSTFAGCVVQKKKLLYIADAYNEREIRKINEALHFDRSRDKNTGILTGQIIANPIFHDGSILGVMEIMNKRGEEKIDDYYQIFLDEIAGVLGKTFFRQLNIANTKEKFNAKFDSLIQNGLITSEQMDKASIEADETKENLATILMEQYNISKRDIGAAFADHFSCPFSAYNDNVPTPSDLLIGIEKYSLENMLWVPLKVFKGKIHVLIDDPSDYFRTSKIEEMLETKSIEYHVALPADILQYIDRFYSSPGNETVEPELELVAAPKVKTAPKSHKENFPEAKVKTQGEQIIIAETTPSLNIKQKVESIPVPEKPAVVIPNPEIHILPSLPNIINEACSHRASDIHFEPDPIHEIVTLRFRIDGQCLTRQILTYREYEMVTREVKMLANLDVNNRTIIQNGKLKLTRPSVDEINMRVAFIPTQTGMEDTVIHLSSKSKKIPLELLGLSEGNYSELVNILRQPRGMVFVVGPSGAGITTTLHACLGNINTPERKIWTAEEPVEITQTGLRQVQIDPQKGFDFPHVLRSFLNADPDVIMASRIYDLETARICMEASIKGRLVLSTLPAETIIDAIEKCLNIGINHLVFADAMLAIMEQRLIKALCPKCKEKYHPSREEYEELADIYGKDAFDKLNIPYSNNFSLFRPKGCKECGQTGYSGRMCVSEIFVFTSQIKRMIRRKESPDSIFQTASAEGITTLLQDGISKVLQGHSDSRHVRLACLK